MTKDIPSDLDITPNSSRSATNDTVAKQTPLTLLEQIVSYEQGSMGEKEVTTFFQQLIDSGMCWTLQGHYGRTAAYLIEAGACHEAVPRNE